MPDAARTTDPVSHGGTIVSGSVDVITEGLGSARYGDMVACAVHGPAAVEQTSATVIVNGRGFARKDDGCLCVGATPVGPGGEALMSFIMSTHESGLSQEEILAQTNGHGPHFEAFARDADGDGVADTFDAKYSTLALRFEGEHGSLEFEALSAEAHASRIRGENAIDGPIPLNQTIDMSARASAFDSSGTVRVGDAEATGNASLLTAEAHAEFLAGDDGRRVGFIASGGAKAKAASAGGTVATNTTAGGILENLGPLGLPLSLGADALGDLSPSVRNFLDTPIRLEASGGVSGGSVGADAEVAAYYDRETEETHLGVGGELAALLGLAVDVRIVIGGKGPEEETGAAGPNLIVSGAGTVIVGD